MELVKRSCCWIFLVILLSLTFIWECSSQRVTSCYDMRGHSVQIGEVYHPFSAQPCVSCLCRLQQRQPGDVADCMTVMCAAPPCDNYERIKEECCGYRCPDEDIDVPLPVVNNGTCQDFRGFFVNVGERFNPDRTRPCIDCRCAATPREPGNYQGCMTAQCRAPPCPNFEPIEGECCGFRCLDSAEEEIDNRPPGLGAGPSGNPTYTLPEQLEPCCFTGKQWYENNREQCPAYTGNLNDGTAEQKRRCKTIADICCIQERERRDCERGVSAARIQGNCQGFQRQADREDATECCSCCLLGLDANNLGLSCSLLGGNFSSRCSESFTECCIGAPKLDPTTARPTTTTQPLTGEGNLQLCRQFQGKLCAHICIDTPGSYRCACRNGFELQSDGRTCRQESHQNRCDLNNPCDHLCVDTGAAVNCKCFDGYTLNADGFTCKDIDECEAGTHNCIGQQNCANTEGSFTCVGSVGDSNPTAPQDRCEVGYAFNSVTRLCEDIDECIINRFTCEPDEECTNNEGSYVCQRLVNNGNCGRGFLYDDETRSCNDMDECKMGTHRCTEVNQKCRNTVGSFVCSCDVGYVYDRRQGSCEDQNECALNHDTCIFGQTCVNTVGSYVCRRTMSCGTGYTLSENAMECEDIDECLLNTHDCSPGRECVNIPGSFRCVTQTCPLGYRLNVATGSCEAVVCNAGLKPSSLGECTDINECTELSSPCRPNQECRNSVGSYSCRDLLQCGPGFELNEAGLRCIDVNECIRGTHDCTGPRMTCVNRRGTYQCQCPTGYQIDHQARRCDDIDECNTPYGGQVCDLNAVCENTEGSFRCICNEGFENKGNFCSDINECDRPGMCQHNCRNTRGSFLCSCFEGYQLSADARTCEDVDECAVYAQRGGSLCLGTCRNTLGSYQCECPEGYRMDSDGRTCQDIDECTQRTASCYEGEEQCINTRGGYKCETVDCPKGFIKAPSVNNRNNSFFSAYDQTTPPDRPYDYRRDSLRSLTGPLPPLPQDDESSMACLRGQCAPADLDCILNTTKTIQWLHVALPTVPLLTEPANIVNMQTEGSNVYPNVRFLILSGNREGKFDVLPDASFPDRGYLRLVQPIRGPREYNVKLRMDHRNAFDYVVSSHIAFVKVYVSRYPY